MARLRAKDEGPLHDQSIGFLRANRRRNGALSWRRRRAMLKRISTILLLAGGALGGAAVTLLIAVAAERWSLEDQCLSANPSRIEALFAPCLPNVRQIAGRERPVGDVEDVETTGSIR
jgi:hypothetical protein